MCTLCCVVFLLHSKRAIIVWLMHLHDHVHDTFGIWNMRRGKKSTHCERTHRQTHTRDERKKCALQSASCNISIHSEIASICDDHWRVACEKCIIFFFNILSTHSTCSPREAPTEVNLQQSMTLKCMDHYTFVVFIYFRFSLMLMFNISVNFNGTNR